MLTVLYLSFHFWKKEKKEMRLIFSGMTDMIQSTYQMEVDDRYDTVNISDGSGMTDMIQSTYQMEVE
jgi:hypothetical protein